MTKKTFNLPEFTNYLNVSEVKNNDFHIVHYAEEKNQLLKSEAVNIDFYILSLKPILHKNIIKKELWDDQSDSFIYIDCPQSLIEWDIEQSSTGYTLMFSSNYLKKTGKNYSFLNYTGLREALFIRKDESDLLWDLYKKTFDEFRKSNYSKDIISGYIGLILTYTQTFYERQFETRSKVYNTIVSDFYQNLENYFRNDDSIAGIPPVTYFAEKASLSPNYFGDLIKNLTGNSPINHIHDFILDFAKKKLKNTNLSVSEISYSLGFDYPNYFARFFRKKTGLSPKTYRQSIE
jgi:YesN/AraC family two-component response regulator